MKWNKTRSRSLAVRVLLWMLLVAFVPLLVMAIQGLHCATQAIVDLESMHLRSTLHARRVRMEDWLAQKTQDLGLHLGAPVSRTNPVAAGDAVAAASLSATVDPLAADSGGLRPDTKVYLLTQEGRMVGKSPRECRRLSCAHGLPDDIAMGSREKVVRYRDCGGNRVLGISVAMPARGWVLVAERDEADAFAWLRTLQLRAFGTGVATLCVVFVLAWRASRRLLVPLRQLSQTARRIADGHWQERVRHLEGAEAEEVGQAFNSMLDELAAVQKRLVQSASLSAIGELSARVVHEMRNPLSSVKMNLKALRDQVKDDPTYAELAEIASGQVARLERMLNDLLQYGKPLELRKAPLRFRDLAEDVTAALAHQAAANEVALRFRDRTKVRSFVADREQIVRAVTNLVDNAIRATARDSTVHVNGDLVGDAANRAVVIAVCDGGPGIPESAQGKLFKPFFTTRSDGTGLGLANVRKIVELHGGAVGVENVPEGGARFTLTFPLGEEP